MDHLGFENAHKDLDFKSSKHFEPLQGKRKKYSTLYKFITNHYLKHFGASIDSPFNMEKGN